MTVSLRPHHIANGIRFDCAHCPVALALNDAFPAHVWRVSGDRAENEDGGRLVLPWGAVQFQRDFDGLGKGVPMEFEVQA